MGHASPNGPHPLRIHAASAGAATSSSLCHPGSHGSHPLRIHAGPTAGPCLIVTAFGRAGFCRALSRSGRATPKHGPNLVGRLVRRLVAQSHVGHLQDVLGAGHGEVDGGRHGRSQLQLGVVHVDHDVVHDHVGGPGRLLGLGAGTRKLGAEADFGNLALEVLAGESVHREIDLGLLGNGSDVGLVDLSDDLHFGQIVGDHEQNGGLEAGRHRLADVYIAFDHHPVDGRGDVGVIEVDLGHLQFGLGLFDVGQGLFLLGPGRSNGGLDLADLGFGLQ